MPAVNQSLIPYYPLGRPNYGDGTSYTNSMDASLAIGGQLAGALAVVPNSPAGMSVLVDTGFTFISTGGAIHNHNGSSPTVVSLAAPGSNSYYAIIYYNELFDSCGVVYGVSSATPIPILPDNVYQKPLAYIVIPSTATSITATMIKDLREMSFSKTLISQLGTLGTDYTLECFGARVVYIGLIISANISLTLNHLAAGAIVNISLASTGSFTLRVGVLLPSGTAITVQGISTSGSATDLGTTGVAITSGSIICLQSAFFSPSIMQFTVIG